MDEYPWRQYFIRIIHKINKAKRKKDQKALLKIKYELWTWFKVFPFLSEDINSLLETVEIEIYLLNNPE